MNDGEISMKIGSLHRHAGFPSLRWGRTTPRSISDKNGSRIVENDGCFDVMKDLQRVPLSVDATPSANNKIPRRSRRFTVPILSAKPTDGHPSVFERL
jgi:hypothetical protein